LDISNFSPVLLTSAVENSGDLTNLNQATAQNITTCMKCELIDQTFGSLVFIPLKFSDEAKTQVKNFLFLAPTNSIVRNFSFPIPDSVHYPRGAWSNFSCLRLTHSWHELRIYHHFAAIPARFLIYFCRARTGVLRLIYLHNKNPQQRERARAASK
jgi:hypothetical protein